MLFSLQQWICICDKWASRSVMYEKFLRKYLEIICTPPGYCFQLLLILRRKRCQQEACHWYSATDFIWTTVGVKFCSFSDVKLTLGPCKENWWAVYSVTQGLKFLNFFWYRMDYIINLAFLIVSINMLQYGKSKGSCRCASLSTTAWRRIGEWWYSSTHS
jgi:hypothetical protein